MHSRRLHGGGTICSPPCGPAGGAPWTDDGSSAQSGSSGVRTIWALEPLGPALTRSNSEESSGVGSITPAAATPWGMEASESISSSAHPTRCIRAIVHLQWARRCCVGRVRGGEVGRAAGAKEAALLARVSGPCCDPVMEGGGKHFMRQRLLHRFYPYVVPVAQTHVSLLRTKHDTDRARLREPMAGEDRLRAVDIKRLPSNLVN
jgi:hypothetical protein